MNLFQRVMALIDEDDEEAGAIPDVMPNYEDLFRDFDQSGDQGSFTDYMVRRYQQLYKQVTNRLSLAERKLRIIESRIGTGMVPEIEYRNLQQQHQALLQELTRLRAQNAYTPNIRHPRGTPNTGGQLPRPPDPRRRPDDEWIDRQREMLRRDLERAMREHSDRGGES